MTDDVCESWEDVDVDKIVIKTDKKPTYSSILAANKNNNLNNAFNDHHFDDLNGETSQPPPLSSSSSSSSSFRIMQRLDENYDNNDNNSPFINQPKIVIEDDNTRIKFVKGLRILNRPNKNNLDKNAIDDKRDDTESIQEKLKKSFKEKQAEYAKARLRILGEVMPDEDLVLNMNQSMNLNNNKDKCNNYNNNNNEKQQQQMFRSINNHEHNNNGCNIIRQPIGPDGTRGFHHRH